MGTRRNEPTESKYNLISYGFAELASRWIRESVEKNTACLTGTCAEESVIPFNGL